MIKFSKYYRPLDVTGARTEVLFIPTLDGPHVHHQTDISIVSINNGEHKNTEKTIGILTQQTGYNSVCLTAGACLL